MKIKQRAHLGKESDMFDSQANGLPLCLYCNVIQPWSQESNFKFFQSA